MHDELFMEMVRYYSGFPKQIQHFTKVYAYAKLIGELEKLPADELFILEAAAIVHDIGIKASKEKYGDSAGPHQEELGPAIAEDMLYRLGYQPKVISRVSYLVGHHHTYHDIDGLDYQILVEADFLVNLFEDDCQKDAVRQAYEKIFRTDAGKKICADMFAI